MSGRSAVWQASNIFPGANAANFQAENTALEQLPLPRVASGEALVQTWRTNSAAKPSCSNSRVRSPHRVRKNDAARWSAAHPLMGARVTGIAEPVSTREAALAFVASTECEAAAR